MSVFSTFAFYFGVSFNQITKIHNDTFVTSPGMPPICNNFMLSKRFFSGEENLNGPVELKFLRQIHGMLPAFDGSPSTAPKTRIKCYVN